MQAAFHVFGMELLVKLDLGATNAFFSAFFRLPDFYWRGFLASSLSSAQLVVFALLMFAVAPGRIQLALMRHLLTNSAGAYLIRHYLGARARRNSPGVLAPELSGCDELGSCAVEGIILLGCWQWCRVCHKQS